MFGNNWHIVRKRNNACSDHCPKVQALYAISPALARSKRSDPCIELYQYKNLTQVTFAHIDARDPEAIVLDVAMTPSLKLIVDRKVYTYKSNFTVASVAKVVYAKQVG
jgi:hypothetical protein